MKYRPEIDGLRALAVVPVIFFHAGFELFSGGFVGVDVFFVISGYLITTILIEDIENKRFSLVNFYERRARRILPALFFVMLVCIPFAWNWMLPNQMKDFSQSLAAVSLFASNLLFWKESGYFEAAAEQKPLLHTWSLAVEEQYYVLFPIFLFLAWRYGKNRVFWMIAVMASISLLLSEWGWRNDASANFYLAPTRAWELFAGSIVAFIVHKNGVQKNNYLALLGLIAIIFSIFIYDKSTPFPSVYALVPVLGVVLLILCADKETSVARLLGSKIFVGVGLISYSAYLWHQPLFAFARIRLVETPSSLQILALIVSSIILAYFSWRYIEKPFRQRDVMSRKVIFSFSLIGVMFFLFLGYQGHSTNGFKSLILNDRELAVLETTERSREPTCEYAIEKCLEFLEHGEKDTILLLGDSNAYHFSSGLRNLADDMSYDLVQLTEGGCLPLAEFYQLQQSHFLNMECITFNKMIKTSLSELDKKVDIIIVSAAWLVYFYGNDLYSEIENLKGLPKISTVRLSLDGENEIRREDREEIFSQYLNSLIKNLSDAANKVIVVGPLPPSITRFDSKFSIFNPRPLLSQNYFNATSSFSKVFREALTGSKVSTIDLASQLCSENFCDVERDGIYLYGDPIHFSHYGQSAIVVPHLRRALQRN
jgi:peptidoglycan/LPS O-acetylase OafA/YrhL